jgi:hypothetical protein
MKYQSLVDLSVHKNLVEAAMDSKECLERMKETFGSREGHLAFQLVTLSFSGQPCDVTFYHRRPIINVKVDQKIATALMYGAGASKLREMLRKICFSDGTAISFGEIWTVNPMPSDGFSEEELNSVNMSEAEECIGPNGETLRKMIRDTYHCTSIEEEDFYLRRFIAS